MMNGKGDKWRGGWTPQYANNFNEIFGDKMKKIYIFDVDGTLTPSRLPMTKEFKKFFKEWVKENNFYLVTGSDLPKLQEQMEGLEIYSSGIFTCCGNEHWEADPAVHPKHCDLIYEHKFKPPQNLLTYLGEQLRMSDYFARCGNHIENRGSMLNFSIVGRDCTLEERANYFEYDCKFKERETIASYIRNSWTDLDAVIGGQISIDIYPKGNDKSQILKHIKQNINMDSHTKTLADSFEYIFIGDRMEKGGNDYPLAQLLQTQDRPYGYTYETEGPEHTQRILEKTHND